MYFLCNLYAEPRASGVVRDVRHFGDVIFQRGRERDTRERAHKKTLTTRNKIDIAEIDETLFNRFFLFFFWGGGGGVVTADHGLFTCSKHPWSYFRLKSEKASSFKKPVLSEPFPPQIVH